MPDERCDYCFREKPTAPLFQHTLLPKVCKGCRYELDKCIGFLEHSGVGIQHTFPSESDTPPDPPKQKKEG